MDDMVITDQRVEFKVLEIDMRFFYCGMFWIKESAISAVVVHTNDYSPVSVGYTQQFDEERLVNIVVTNEVIKLLDTSKKAMFDAK
jgi:hypothetical protein